MTPLDQALLSNGRGYPRICPTPKRVRMTGQRNFRELLLFFLTTIKLRGQDEGDLEGN